MADPTGARMRVVNAFFDSPRFAIKEIPPGKGEQEAESTGDACPETVELPGWNAYIGPPRP